MNDGIDLLKGTQTSLLLARTGPLARFSYLCLTVAVTVAAWFALAAIASPFITPKGGGTSDSIRVDNARNKRTPLPLKYAVRIEALPGVASLSYLDLQLIQCGADMVTVNAVGGSTVAKADVTYFENEFDADALERWQKDRLGLLVSRAAAAKCGWQLGQGIEPMSIAGKPMPLHISGVGLLDNDDLSAMAHFDYINEEHSMVAKPGNVMMIHVDASAPGQNQALAARIEAAFAHDDPPVAAYPDTVREDARSRMGKVQYLVVLVMGALFLSCLLVLASVMAHAATERRTTLGMMRVLGFPRRVLAGGYVLEVLGIVLCGAVLGMALGQVVLHYLPLVLKGQLLRVAPAPWAWSLLPIWLALMAALSLLQPCLLALRARPLDCREN
ncbi:MAG TPA: FtsX-like permease family protein [Chiayiivirga sp.]|nr:FtsX-like permease family protein [Chiayiivirga sp.]